MHTSRLLGLLFVAFFVISCTNNFDPSAIEQHRTAEFMQDSLHLVAHLEQAIIHPQKADSLIGAADLILEKDEHHKDAYYYNLAEYYAAIGNYVKTKIEIEKGFEYLGGDTLDSEGLAKYYNLLGVIHTSQNDFEEAMHYYTSALEIFGKHNYHIQSAVVYTNLANLFNSKSEFTTALKYSLLSDSLLNSMNDTLYQGPIKSLLAVTYLYNKMVDSAFKYGFEAIEINKRYHKDEGVITAHVAVGEIHTYINQFDSALYYFNTSKRLCLEFNNNQAMLIVENNLMYLHSKMGKYHDVIKHGKRALALAQQFEEKNAEYDLYIALAKSYEQINQIEEAYEYLSLAEISYRELSNKQSDEIIQELLISFEDEKKNSKILKQDKKLQTFTYGIFILCLFIITLLLSFFLYRRRLKHKDTLYAQQMTQKILLAVSEGEEIERERIAMELHNGIASNLVGARMILEGLDEKKPILDKLEHIIGKTYEEVRLIAHNLMPINFDEVELPEAIRMFVEDINMEEGRIFFSTDLDHIPISKELAHILYRTTQEFVQNALKYSQAKSIMVSMSSIANELILIIEDDGIGIDEMTLQHSSSINKTRNMLEILDVYMNVDTKPSEYTIITIKVEIPLV